MDFADVHAAPLLVAALLQLPPHGVAVAEFVRDAEHVLRAAIHIGEQKRGVQRIDQRAEGDVCLDRGGRGVDHLVREQIRVAVAGLQSQGSLRLLLHPVVDLLQTLQGLLPASLRAGRRVPQQIDHARLRAVFGAAVKVLEVGAVDRRKRLLELLPELPDVLAGVAHPQHVEVGHLGVAFIPQKLRHLLPQLHQLPVKLSQLLIIFLNKLAVIGFLPFRLQFRIEHLPLRGGDGGVCVLLIVLRFQLLLLLLQREDVGRACAGAHLQILAGALPKDVAGQRAEAGLLDHGEQLAVAVLDAGVPGVEIVHLLAVKAVAHVGVVADLGDGHHAVKVLRGLTDPPQREDQPKGEPVVLRLFLRLLD